MICVNHNKVKFFNLFLKILLANILINVFSYIWKCLSSKCYQENKEKLQNKARERYQIFSKEVKEKKLQYGRERFKNLSEEKSKSLSSIEKNIIEREKRFSII